MSIQTKQPFKCCISHKFHQIAITNPNKTAIISTNSTKKTSKILQNDEKPKNNTKVHTFTHHKPQLCDKDRIFTYYELLLASNSLSFKLNHVINGGDDPNLLKPISGVASAELTNLRADVICIGVYMVPSVEYIVTVLSILRCGYAFLPIDPYWPKQRIISVISSSNVDLIVGCSKFENNISAHLVNKSHWLLACCKVNVLCVDIDDIVEQKCGKLGLDLVWPCESSESRKFSYLMYTSGSTGTPKGVCGREDGVLNRFLWMEELYPLSKDDDVLLFKTSISFIDHIQEFLAPLLVGCTLAIPPFDELRKNMYILVDFIDEYHITRLALVPSLIKTILPSLEKRYSEGIESSLKMLVLSGEVFPITLWKTISRVFSRTCILNIYGSTEVAGDCSYLDCKRLPSILESEILTSVPIGEPISNCEIQIVNDDGKQDEGEICVSGVCVSSGYLSENDTISLDCIRLGDKLYYKTGDFAKRLKSGDLVFLGRKDRTIKVNGQRIALEEVENTLRQHPKVSDIAVVFCNKEEEHAFLGAALVLNDTRISQSSEFSGFLNNWMVERLPSVMIPREIVSVEEIPTTSSGKVDYTSISSLFSPDDSSRKCGKMLVDIKEAFCKALGVVEIGNDDDFFAFGGDSILSAHIAHKLGIDMRLLYMNPTPSQLYKAINEKESIFEAWENDSSKLERKKTLRKARKDENDSSKRVKLDTGTYSNPKTLEPTSWYTLSVSSEYSLSRCNKTMHKTSIETNKDEPPLETLIVKLPREINGAFIQRVCRIPMDSCVDASPLVVFKNKEILVLIGSHSSKFICFNAKNGVIQWEVKLQGRIESTAAIDGDFSQVIVGCYQGNIYFINILNGIISWTFLTGGEVKSQPTIDRFRHLVWCGSHDHTLYALDYRNYSCVYRFPCGGTIFGAPLIDEGREILYLATTNGRLTAITLKNSSFSCLWSLDLKVPIFGSISMSCNGNVVCCLVNGDVLCVNVDGSIVWRCKIDGPIFAGPTISMSLGLQAIICSRNGIVYSFDLETGRVIWEYNVGDPITASACVDDHMKLVSCDFSEEQRLVCVCSSSGRVLLLLVRSVFGESGLEENMVRKFAEIDLDGDIFSSPVMVGGQIFVGCRDDYLHCLVAETGIKE